MISNTLEINENTTINYLSYQLKKINLEKISDLDLNIIKDLDKKLVNEKTSKEGKNFLQNEKIGKDIVGKIKNIAQKIVYGKANKGEIGLFQFVKKYLNGSYLYAVDGIVNVGQTTEKLSKQEIGVQETQNSGVKSTEKINLKKYTINFYGEKEILINEETIKMLEYIEKKGIKLEDMFFNIAKGPVGNFRGFLDNQFIKASFVEKYCIKKDAYAYAGKLNGWLEAVYEKLLTDSRSIKYLFADYKTSQDSFKQDSFKQDSFRQANIYEAHKKEMEKHNIEFAQKNVLENKNIPKDVKDYYISDIVPNIEISKDKPIRIVVSKTDFHLYVFDGYDIIDTVPVGLGSSKGDYENMANLDGNKNLEAKKGNLTTPGGKYTLNYISFSEEDRKDFGTGFYGIKPQKGTIGYGKHEVELGIHGIYKGEYNERLQQLTDPNVKEKRMSYGCINCLPDWVNDKFEKIAPKVAEIYITFEPK